LLVVVPQFQVVVPESLVVVASLQAVVLLSLWLKLFEVSKWSMGL
jgi:hypothetical protein